MTNITYYAIAGPKTIFREKEEEDTIKGFFNNIWPFLDSKMLEPETYLCNLYL